jgi:hypothetical protein
MARLHEVAVLEEEPRRRTGVRLVDGLPDELARAAGSRLHVRQGRDARRLDAGRVRPAGQGVRRLAHRVVEGLDDVLHARRRDRARRARAAASARRERGGDRRRRQDAQELPVHGNSSPDVGARGCCHSSACFAAVHAPARCD